MGKDCRQTLFSAPYVSVGKECRQTLLSAHCSVCIKWIHKRYSGLLGDLSLLADGFRCRRCDGSIQEADLSGGLVVDGETYGSVKSFSYMGDTLHEDGGFPLCQK